MDANSFLKRIILIGLFSVLPTFALAAPGGSGHSSGGSSGGHSGGGHSGGGHGFSASHGNVGGRAYAWQHGNRYWHGTSGSGQWNHGDWHHGDWHHGDRDHHHRFSFGFFPYWYPGYGGYGYYDYGYPYYADYSDYYPEYPSDYGSGPARAALFVQDALARRGYYEGEVDGVIGSQTRSAIREFQRDNGLPVTGQINSSLLRTLRNARG
jgi:hypothetical protein